MEDPTVRIPRNIRIALVAAEYELEDEAEVHRLVDELPQDEWDYMVHFNCLVNASRKYYRRFKKLPPFVDWKDASTLWLKPLLRE
jgi:hypothetical protein